MVQPLGKLKILLKSRTSLKFGLVERLKVLWITTSVYWSSAACGEVGTEGGLLILLSNMYFSDFLTFAKGLV